MPPGAVELPDTLRGKVFLRRPVYRDENEFLSLVDRSRRFLAPWTSPPADPTAYASYLKRCESPDFEAWLVCLPDHETILGVFNLSQIVRGYFLNAYLGYWVGVDFAGRGYMSAGLRLVLAYAFTGLKLHRLEANIQPGNVDSIQLARRGGFVLEGYSPRYLKIHGRWRDHERWAIRAETWRTSSQLARVRFKAASGEQGVDQVWEVRRKTKE